MGGVGQLGPLGQLGQLVVGQLGPLGQLGQLVVVGQLVVGIMLLPAFLLFDILAGANDILLDLGDAFF